MYMVMPLQQRRCFATCTLGYKVSQARNMRQYNTCLPVATTELKVNFKRTLPDPSKTQAPHRRNAGVLKHLYFNN